MLRAIVFFRLTASAFASATFDVLVNAASSFSATIQQQLEMLQSDPSPAELAEKTIDYAEAKEAYFKAKERAGPRQDPHPRNVSLKDPQSRSGGLRSVRHQLSSKVPKGGRMPAKICSRSSASLNHQ
jgi:hypothetical protein